MDENALERFFDKYIANEYTEEENMEEENDEDEFFRLLPDELLLYYNPGQGETSCPDPHADLNPPTNTVPPEGYYRAGFTIKISNVMSTANLGCNLDLGFIARNTWNVEWNPKTFYRLNLRFRKPRATVSVFSKGCVVCFGCECLEESKVATRRCARKIQKLGFPVTFKNFKIKNIVANTRIAPLRLDQMALAHKETCSYDPELFPSLFYNRIPGISVTIGHNGGIALIGN
ncbi:TATA-box-binding protein-like [Parambassis ranga]|uniref:TATA-box-binding protein-like n=1 Tax=Parambassis ranga TaxID=210632 RepID=A0A6P7KFQ5_9TELE|nr:TATA-box-binding protein-like [Parambassis ranga]